MSKMEAAKNLLAQASAEADAWGDYRKKESLELAEQALIIWLDVLSTEMVTPDVFSGIYDLLGFHITRGRYAYAYLALDRVFDVLDASYPSRAANPIYTQVTTLLLEKANWHHQITDYEMEMTHLLLAYHIERRLGRLVSGKIEKQITELVKHLSVTEPYRIDGAIEKIAEAKPTANLIDMLRKLGVEIKVEIKFSLLWRQPLSQAGAKEYPVIRRTNSFS